MPMLEKTGSTEFAPSIDSTLLPEHFAGCLHRVHASEVSVQSDRVRFAGGAFRFVTSCNVLYPFGPGEITIDAGTHKLAYRLDHRQPAVFAVLAFLLGSMVLLSLLNLAWLMLVLPFFCLLMAFISVRVGVLRFENFLRRSLGPSQHQEVARSSGSVPKLR